MRVVHLFKDYFPPTTGGIEQHMQLLCSGLARSMDVSVLVPSHSFGKRVETVNGVEVVRVPELGRYAAVPFCPTMPRELARLKPDIVHLHFPNPMGDLSYLFSGKLFTPVRLLRLVVGGSARYPSTRYPSIPLIISYHADVIRQRRLLPLYTPILNAVFRRAQRIIAAAEETIASSDVLMRYKERCTVIPYGVDLRSFDLTETESVEVQRRRATAGEGLVLFVGVLRPYKGVDVLLKAMARVRARLVVVGRGPTRLELSGLAARLGISNRVLFLGEVSDSERRILLHACDVFVLPSIDNREAFGIAQLEAMACGRPVIASDLPTGVRFVNKNQMTGLLVPPGDSDALAAALQRLLGDERLRQTLGNAAKRRAELEFSAERMVRRVQQVYEEVLGGRR
jgi:glycosyltransferase involved in cell wall biosynthesis